MPEHTNIEFNIELKSGNVVIPFEKIPTGAAFFVPFGFEAKGIKIKYSTAMLVDMESDALIFRAVNGIEPVLCLENGDIVKLSGEQRIGNTKIILSGDLYPDKSSGEALEVIGLPKNTIGFERFEHLNLNDKTREYKIKLCENTKYIKIYWLGNVAALYADREFVTDNYFYGEPWVVDVSDIAGRDIIIKIQPMDENEISEIYLDVIPETGHVAPVVEGFDSEYLYV